MVKVYQKLTRMLAPRIGLYFGVMLAFAGVTALLGEREAAVAELTARIPGWLGPPALIVLASDALVTCAALRREGTTDVLRWYAPE